MSTSEVTTEGANSALDATHRFDLAAGYNRRIAEGKLIDKHTLSRIRGQMARAELILFTGAGFSFDARDRSGRPLPSVDQLKRELWDLVFPGEPFDARTTLGDVYHVALARQGPSLKKLLQTRLSIDPDTLPEYYRAYFDMPWLRWYTLNVDDIATSVAQRFELDRGPKIISATLRKSDERPDFAQGLEYVYLNGVFTDGPEHLTFSETQYAERIARQEPWYSRCVADLTSRPVVFIGTELREMTLWQHLELRGRAYPQGRDLRPTSILISPDLEATRREILREYRIEWVKGTAVEFAEEVLAKLKTERTKGFAFLSAFTPGYARRDVALVSHLVSEKPNVDTEYLLGEEPQWADLLTGRAIQRTNDSALLDLSLAILAGDYPATAVAVTGTAGTGKSTALMALSLKLSGDGIPVMWVDRDSEAGPTKIRAAVRESRGRLVLAVDDADLFGPSLIPMVRDLVPARDKFLFVFAVRSGKLDDTASAIARGGEVKLVEHTVPPLTDEDIDRLIDVLERNNRLGILRNKSARERREAFRQRAGRQLLVAMIEATTGKRFEEKIHDELMELSGLQRYVYAAISLAFAQRYELAKDEILIAVGDERSEAMTALDRLTARHLIAATSKYQYKARHRYVADAVVSKLVELHELKDVIHGLAFAAAAKVTPGNREGRTFRFLTRITNHEFLKTLIGPHEARDLYDQLESSLSFDFHYWLQRGSLEVEVGDLPRAENFLNQAKSMAPDDYKVDTEYGYMLMRKACAKPTDLRAHSLLDEGIAMLEGVISLRGDLDFYPFHVLGLQALAWVHCAGLDSVNARAFLDRIRSSVEEGCRKHPGKRSLLTLRDDLKREALLTVTMP